mmetsp:Transcript_92608/g.205826  ORF Transcript_92608/g.205826 Transcript_92608/m.205826 type:complete len:194 (+) Transcript_92608:162-743(+)
MHDHTPPNSEVAAGPPPAPAVASGDAMRAAIVEELLREVPVDNLVNISVSIRSSRYGYDTRGNMNPYAAYPYQPTTAPFQAWPACGYAVAGGPSAALAVLPVQGAALAPPTPPPQQPPPLWWSPGTAEHFAAPPGILSSEASKHPAAALAPPGSLSSEAPQHPAVPWQGQPYERSRLRAQNSFSSRREWQKPE